MTNVWKSNFAVFSENGHRGVEEWFAETYAKFTLEASTLPSELRIWFENSCPVPALHSD